MNNKFRSKIEYYDGLCIYRFITKEDWSHSVFPMGQLCCNCFKRMKNLPLTWIAWGGDSLVHLDCEHDFIKNKLPKIIEDHEDFHSS